MLHSHPEARFQTREQMQAHIKSIAERQERTARLIARQRELDALEAVKRASAAKKETRLVGAAEQNAKQKSLRLVLRDIAKEHGVTVSDLLSRSYGKKVIAARLSAYAAVQEARPSWSTTRLGMFFGRDHTTILHALQRMGAR